MQPSEFEPIEVRRSGLRMWLLSLAGVPLVVLGVDVLRSRRIIAYFQNLIWPGGNPELLEPRDYIWAVVLVVVGLIIAGYGVVELVNPRPVLQTDHEGISLRLGHPLARASLIPWTELIDVGSEEVDDEGDVVPVLWLKLSDPTRVPKHPWGARWLDPNTLAILASDWERTPQSVAIEVARASLATARLPRSAPTPVS